MLRPSSHRRARPVRASVFALAATLLACGATPKPPPSTPTQTTSATVPATSENQLASARISDLELARDRALRRADDAQALAAAQRERNDKALHALAVRN